MGKRSPFELGPALSSAIVLLLLIQSTISTEEKCRTGCHGAAKTFKYVEGTTYKYNYDGKITIALPTAAEQTTNLEVKATVLLSQQSDCNQILRLQNVEVIDGSGKKHAQIPDIAKPIRVNFHDGHLEDSICVDPKDTQNSLNIKRAIASIFQANLGHSHETDVFGLCQTDISQHQEGPLLVITKTRNLNKCAYRENIKQDFLATTFNQDSEIKSSPVLNGDYSARIQLKNGILDQATITEHYLYVPFSVGKNGANAQIVSKLSFAGTSKDGVKFAGGKARSIIFENPHPITTETSNVNSILGAVRETAKTIDQTVSEQTAKEFVNLIKILRVSKKDDILAAYNQVKAGVGFADKTAAKKLFLDALLRAGNGNSVEVAIALLKNKELSHREEKIVYLGLSFVRHATEESITSAISLVNQKHLPREALLGIGNLAGRYCRQHNCDNSAPVKKLIQTLTGKLSNKPTTRDQENEQITLLKAISNTHHVPEETVKKIIQIAQDKSTTTRLRVAALDAYLSAACHASIRDSALSILKDTQQDSEVRIKAYLALAQCPTSTTGPALKELLEHEPSYQVGGFIVSHLRNLKASANPDKALAKQHLNLHTLPNKFPVDFRKWSYNGEFSYAIDTLGLGSSTEANVIYSQQSYLPRSASLNLTAELFGHTFNFLELEARQENLDKLVEHYLGPKGVLKSHSWNELWKNKEKSAKDILEHLKNKLGDAVRVRRDTKSEIDALGKNIQLTTNDLNRNLDLDYSLKAFGSELVFLNINDDIRKWTPEAIIDKLVDEFSKGLDRLKTFEETVRVNTQFLDGEFAYPTGLGMPLRLALEGTANVQVKAKGHVDVRSLIQNKDTKVQLSLIPSATVEVAGRLTLDALVVENGLKVISTLHSSTGNDLTIDLFGQGGGLDVKLSLPVKEQKLVSVNHEIVFHTRKLAEREVNTPLKFAQNKDFSVCLDQLSGFIGLTFCGDINGPNLSGKEIPVLPFPLSGDAKVAVTIENDDVSEYHFRSAVNGAAGADSAELIFETLGKNKQPKLSFQIKAALAPEPFVKATLISAVKKAEAEGRITNNNKEKSMSLRLSHDNAEYFGKIGVEISGTPSKATYKPILVVKTPEGEKQLPYNIQGQIIAEQNGGNVKYTFDNVKASISGQKTITIKGNLGKDGQAFFTDLTLADEAASANLKGRLQVNPNLLKFHAEFQNTLNPDVGFDVKGELKRQDEHFDSSLQVVIGRDLNSKTQVLTLTNSLTYKIKTHDFVVATKNRITYPYLELDSKFEFEQTPKTLDYDLDVKYSDVKFGSELELKYNQKVLGDYQVEFDVWGFDNRVEVKASREVSGDDSKVGNTVVVNGKKLDVSGKIRHHVKPTNLDVGTDLVITLPGHSTTIKVVSSYKVNANELDAQQTISDGGNTLVDFFLKANKQGNANGNLKVNIKDHLTINGQVKANKGVGNAEILVDLQKIKRQVKAASSFNVQLPSTVNVEITLWPLFNEDPAKKVVISTNNKVTPTSIDSKNNVDILGSKLDANLKGHLTEEPKGFKLDGQFDVTLPTEQYLAGKLNLNRNVENGVLNGRGEGSLEYRKNKNTTGKKISWKGVAKNTNPQARLVDIEHSISLDNGDGGNLSGDLHVKSTKTKWEVLNKIHGTALDDPIENKWVLTCNEGVGDYELTSTCGKNKAHLIGKFDLNRKGKPISGDVTLTIDSTSKTLKTLKFSANGKAKKPETPSDYLELNGGASLLVDDGSDDKIDVKVDGSVKASDKDGQLTGHYKCHKQEPVSISGGYGRKEVGSDKQLTGNVAAQYGSKTIKSEVVLTKQPGHAYKLSLQLDLPTEKYRSNKLTVQSKRSDDGKHVVSHLEVTSDGKKWTSDSEFNFSKESPLIDVQVKDPEGKLSQLKYKYTPLPKGNKAEYKVLCEKKGFLLEGDSEVQGESADNFQIKAHINSPSLKLNQIAFEAKTKPDSNGRQIEVKTTSAGKEVYSGSATYTARDEQGKHIIEGSGSFKVRGEAKSANFKYIRQQLTQEKNGEQGVESSFDASLGARAIDIEVKLTNKQLRLSHSLCEEKKECTHVEFDLKVNKNELNQYNSVLEIAVDLRKLGFTHEFGLKGVTNRKDWTIEHTVDVHFQNTQNSKYQYSVNLRPGHGDLSLTTPKRVVAIEVRCTLANAIKNGGKGHQTLVFYSDKKNHPDRKTSLTTDIDVDKRGTFSGKSQFVHPALARPLTTSLKVDIPDNDKVDLVVNLELDVFAQANQKLSIDYKTSLTTSKTALDSSESLKVSSTGLGVNLDASEVISVNRDNYEVKYDAKIDAKIGKVAVNNVASLRLSKHNLNVLLKAWNVDLLKVISKFTIDKDQQIVDTEIGSYNNNPLDTHLEIKHWNTLKYTIGYKKDANKKLQFSAGLIPNQIADVRADLINAGSKNNLFFASLKLDDSNFLKADHGVNSKNIESLVQRTKEDSQKFVEGLSDVGKKWSKEASEGVANLGEASKKATPNLTPIKEYYVKELKSIKDELLEDKTIRELSEAFQNIFGAVIHAAAEVLDRLSDLAENVAKTIQVSFEKVLKLVEKDLIPLLKTNADRIVKTASKVLGTVLEITLAYLTKVSKILEQYQPELQKISTALGEITKDLGQLAGKQYVLVRDTLLKIWQDLYERIKSQSFFEELKAQYEELVKKGIPNAQALKGLVQEIADHIQDGIPDDFPEVKALVKKIVSYIEKKLSNEEVNDVAVLEDIAKSAVLIVRKTVGGGWGKNDLAHALANPISLDWVTKLPKLVAMRFSPLGHLDKDEAKAVVAFILSLYTKPQNWLPPFQLSATISQSQHIFTFDGKHLNFPGKCGYLLARDAIDGNFSIGATYDQSGELATITLMDHSDAITLKKGGQVLLNNAVTELPVRKPASRPTLGAWRDYSAVHLASDAGVRVTCEPNLEGCGVYVSGFYHGQLRGLLGNGNNEPYDDWTTSGGKIVTDGSEFVNSYKLQAGCAAVTVVEDKEGATTEACNKLFGWESNLNRCFAFIRPDSYKRACSSGGKGAERAAVAAYVKDCTDRNVPVRLPAEFVKCTNSEKPVELGEQFSVKLPGKAADIVLLIDTVKSNEAIYKELVQPLVQEVGKALHGKGINDVEFHVIAFGGENQWPSHVTVGGKLTFKGKAPNLKFADEPKHDKLDAETEKKHEKVLETLRKLARDLKLALGLDLQAQTYVEGIKYPFRSHAVKSFIVSTSRPCQTGTFLPLQKLRTLFFRGSLIKLNLITPFDALNVKDAKKTKDVIGFNSENVFTISQAKKKPDGTSELYKDLQYNDYCVDFTIKNNGNVFVSDNFIAAKADGKKQFIQSAAHNIVAHLTETEEGLDCECTYVTPYQASNVCSVVSKIEKKKKV